MEGARVDAGALFRAHAPFVTGFLTQLGAGRGDVEDLVQEVFLVAHRRGGFVPGAARPTTWLAEIALRVAWKSRRHGRRHPEDPDDGARLAAAPTAGASPAQAAETAQSLERISRALQALELDRRALFILFEIEGESCESIAAGLQLPITTVYSRLHVARREFMRAYDRLAAAERRIVDGPAPGARP